MSLTPEQLKALQSSLAPAHEAAQELNVSLDLIERFERNVKEFVLGHHKSFTGKAYQFTLDLSQTGASSFDLAAVRDFIFQGNGLLRVDSDFRLIDTSSTLKNFTELSRVLGASNQLGFFVDGTYFWEILCGRSIDEGDLVTGQNSLELSSSVPRRPMKDFDLLLQDHYDLSVRNEAGFCYWKKKSERILLRGPHGTEWIFQHDLFDWIRKFAIDKLRVYAEPSGFGQDKHDITVVTEVGTYVIEVKWLGKNEKNNSYGLDRINEGLDQVKTYLENDDSLYKGFLVAYDGRSFDEHQNASSHNEIHRHPNCEAPKIVFLESENPSKQAVKAVKESKNDPAN